MRLVVLAGPEVSPQACGALASELARREGTTRVALVDADASAQAGAFSATCSTVLVRARHPGALLRVADALVWWTTTIAPPPTRARTIVATTHPTFAYPAPTIRLPADAQTLASALG